MHVSNEPACHARLALAVEFAKRHGSHLVGVGCAIPPAADPWLGYVDGRVLQVLLEEQRVEMAKTRASFDACAAPLGSNAHWIEQVEFASRSLAEHAAGADLVIGGPEHGAAASTADVGDLVFECGLPVVMIPHGVRELSFDTIVVAWRDTVDARHAVSAALPFLERAKLVVVLSVEGRKDKGEPSGLEDVRRRLDRHGVRCETSVRRGSNDQAPDIILETAREKGAGLIVLGAYGHSRAREWILGGVTNGLLDNSPIPLFLMH